MITEDQLKQMLKNKSVTVEEKPKACVISNPSVMKMTVPGEPIPAPRQTQRDKWMKRPCVMRYREYADRLRSFINLNDLYVGRIEARFFLAMPHSWSAKKKIAHEGKPHRVKPDGDNLLKSVQDALLKNDSMVWSCSIEKRWCVLGHERTELIFSE